MTTSIFPTIENDILDMLATETRRVYIKMVKRNRKKCTTIIEGLDEKIDLIIVLKVMRKKLCCNGHIALTKDGKECIVLTGDQREKSKRFLVEENVVSSRRNIIVSSI